MQFLPTAPSHHDHLETLGEISRVLTATLDPRDLYEAIFQQMARVTEVTYFFVAMPDSAGVDLVVPYLRDAGKLILDQRIPMHSTLTGWVLRTGETLHFDSDAEYREFAASRHLPAVIIGSGESEAKVFVPLRQAGETVGVLSVQSAHSGTYDADDVRMLSIIAGQAAVAIRNAQLFQEQRRRMREMEILGQMVRELTPLHDVDSIAQVVGRHLCDLIPHDSCHLYLPEGRRQDTVIGASLEEVGIGDGVVRWVAHHRRSLYISNTLADDRCRARGAVPRVPCSLLAAPLAVDDGVRGVVALTARGVHRFQENDESLLEMVAGQVGIMLDRASLYRDLQEQATTDALTRLYNRRFLQDRLTEERSRARRNGYSLAAIMLDVDKFKQINDTYGHHTGDSVLREVAALIRGCVRAEDVVARYGGEEFCILLPQVGEDEITVVAERLRTSVERHVWSVGLARVTVSVGAVVVWNTMLDDDVLRMADDAMYSAKRAGGNGVCVVQTGTPVT